MKSVSPRKIPGKLLLSFVFPFLMAGCAATGGGPQAASSKGYTSDWMYTGNSITYLSEAHSNKVEQAGPGEVVSLARTPWGENTRIEVNTTYFSASGKPCFSTTITSQSVTPYPVNLCKYGSGRWGATRAFSPAETDRPQLTVGDTK